MAFHLFDINELYSNASGTIQFIELVVGSSNGENFWQGQTISVTQGGTTNSFTFPSNLPSSNTANKSVLVATQGFADLNIVTPDYIVPAGFLFTDGGTVNFANVDSVTYSSLPTNGTSSIDRNGAAGTNSPTNFAGQTGTVPPFGSGTITGTQGPDDLIGTLADDDIEGLGGNDTLTGFAGDDTLDGGAGADTAVFGSNRASYTVTSTPSGITVSGPDGNDTLISIERFDFTDRDLAIDLGLGQSAGNTVRLIGAAFDAPAISAQPDWVGIGLDLFDSGLSMPTVSALVAQILGLNNTDFVNTVYENVVGVPPSQGELDFYVGLLQGSGGTLTQGQLLELAANAPVNETNIDLVGLQATGVEFVPA